MADTTSAAAVNGDAVFGLRALASNIVSTILNGCTLLAALAIFSSNKSDAIQNVGTPDVSALMTGANLSPAKQKEIQECQEYDPLIEAIYQSDIQAQAYRGNMPTLSVGSGAVLTPTVTNNTIASVAITNAGTGFAGAPPTLVVTDIGGGAGAIIRATISGGVISAVTIISGGYNYSASTAIIVNTGNTAGTKTKRPVFRWNEYISAGYVYYRDLRRAQALAAGNTQYFNQMANDLLTTEQMRQVSGQIQRVEQDFIYGSPSNENDLLWDAPWGIANAIRNDNTYAGLDRTVAANYFWQAKYDTTAHTFSLEQLEQDALLNKGMQYNGGNVDVFIVGPALFGKYQRESQTYTMNANTDPNVQVIKRQFGFKTPVIKYNNTYVISDINIKPNQVFGLNLASWIVAFRNGAHWTCSQPADQRKIEGGKDAQYFTVDTQTMFICVAPSFNVNYTNVS